MSRHTHYPMFNLVEAQVPDDLSPVATVMSPMLPGDWRSMRPVVNRDKCVKCASSRPRSLLNAPSMARRACLDAVFPLFSVACIDGRAR